MLRSITRPYKIELTLILAHQLTRNWPEKAIPQASLLLFPQLRSPRLTASSFGTYRKANKLKNAGPGMLIYWLVVFGPGIEHVHRLLCCTYSVSTYVQYGVPMVGLRYSSRKSKDHGATYRYCDSAFNPGKIDSHGMMAWHFVLSLQILFLVTSSPRYATIKS